MVKNFIKIILKISKLSVLILKTFTKIYCLNITESVLIIFFEIFLLTTKAYSSFKFSKKNKFKQSK